MFDGIDIVTLPVADIASLRALYVDLFGFEVVEEAAPGEGWQQVWGLPRTPSRSLLIGKPGSAGGWIRLVEVPGLPAAELTSRADRVGPLALDFYVRSAESFEGRVEAAGWRFLTEAVHYPLPGTDTEVRERMLAQSVSGLLHATVKYRPRQTRCVLDGAERADVSEVVACVFVTDDFAGAQSFAQNVLGAQRYFTGRFDGATVERMLGLATGEGFEAALFRGPSSRNARLEFAERMEPVAGTLPPDPIPRVVAGCAIDDLDGLAAALADGSHGESTGIVPVEWHGALGRRLGLRSRYGAAFEFWDRTSR
jgi:catechol 2,3-dioxygenase-like lactoylglutathione lyase family enzyme